MLNIDTRNLQTRRDNYAALIIQMAFFHSVLSDDKAAAMTRSKRKRACSHARTRRRARIPFDRSIRGIDGSRVREKPYLQACARTSERASATLAHARAPRHRIALTIGIVIINYVALKENELPRAAATMLKCRSGYR